MPIAGPILRPFPCSQAPRLPSPAYQELVLSILPRPSLASTLLLTSQRRLIGETQPVPGRWSTQRPPQACTGPAPCGLHLSSSINGMLTEAHRHHGHGGLCVTHMPLHQKTASLPHVHIAQTLQEHLRQELTRAAAYSHGWCAALEGHIKAHCLLHQQASTYTVNQGARETVPPHPPAGSSAPDNSPYPGTQALSALPHLWLFMYLSFPMSPPQLSLGHGTGIKKPRQKS